MRILVLIIAAGLIGAIIWWFFGNHKQAKAIAHREGNLQTAEITVDGGYQPAVVELQAGVPAKLVFNRKDSSACFDEVILPDFFKRARLPIGQPHAISFTPGKPGEYTYSCGMHMFFGKIAAKD